MARVPYAPEPEILPHDEPAPNQRIEASPNAFGAATARAVAGVGAELEKGANVFGAVALSQQQLYDETYANSAAVDITQKQTEEYEKSLASRKGAAAMEALPEYKKKLEENYDAALAAAPNDRTRAMIARQSRYVTDHWLGTGTQYAAGQQRVWQQKTVNDKRDTMAAQALLAINDPPAMESFLRGSDDAVRQEFENQHYDKDTVDQEVRKNRGRNYEKIIKTMIDDPEKGPVVASKFFKEHVGEMDAASAVTVSTALKTGLNTVAGRETADVVMNRGISGKVEQIAQEEGVDPDKLKRTIKVESGGNPNLSAPNGHYHGLGQLSMEEFTKHGGRGNIFNVEENLRATARKMRSEELDFEAKHGRPPTFIESYMIHQQGEGGAAAHAANPNGLAWQNMLSTGEGRQKGEAWARKAIWGNIADQDKPRFGSVDNVTSGQFVAYWNAKLMGTGSNMLPEKSVAFERIVQATAGNPVQQNAALAWMNHVYSIYEGNKNSQLATFKTRLDDSTAEALHAGSVSNPIPPEEFYEQLGFEKGEIAYRQYQDDIQYGADAHSITGMTEAAQSDLLEKRQPPAGQAGYAERVKNYESLEKTIDDNRKQRQTDPVSSVKEDSFVKQAQLAARDGKQGSWDALVTARLAAQERLGIPESQRSPITYNEAIQLTQPLHRMLPGQERAVMAQMQDQFQQLFKENAPAAWAYAMKVNKMSAEAGKAATQIFNKLNKGIQPTRDETSAVDTAAELDAANSLTSGWHTGDTVDISGAQYRITNGQLMEVVPLEEKKSVRPNDDIPADAIKALMADPKKADQFNQKYAPAGKDLAKEVLEKYKIP